MNKKTKIIVTAVVAGVVVVGTAAVAGPIIYRDLIAGEAAAAPTISPAPDSGEAPAGGDADPVDVSGTWTVAGGSEAGYRVDEVLNGTDVTVTGRTDDVDGTLVVDGLTLTDAEITVDVASIATDSGQRDAYFRDTALRADEFPTATFALTEPVTADEVPVGGVQTFEATGELTIAGVSNEVTFELEAALDGDVGQLAGAIPITFADYGVEAPDLGFVSVEEAGAVEFQLTLARD
ncbi:YceI family protein [Microbacterium karelineae]|uniref:YceI family protein n=1 Tax=Microbacterium karelineae TaxID=2654283 RepID=UPI0012EAEED0|nr:YceI family protein [Microbacterium karelineae]